MKSIILTAFVLGVAVAHQTLINKIDYQNDALPEPWSPPSPRTENGDLLGAIVGKIFGDTPERTPKGSRWLNYEKKDENLQGPVIIYNRWGGLVGSVLHGIGYFWKKAIRLVLLITKAVLKTLLKAM